MNKVLFFGIYLLMGFAFTCSPNNNTNMDNDIDKIIELESEDQNESNETTKKYTISEAAVGKINGVVIKVGGIYAKDEAYYIKLKYAEKYEKVFVDDVLQLDEQTRVKVLEINYAEEPQKGNVVLELLEY